MEIEPREATETEVDPEVDPEVEPVDIDVEALTDEVEPVTSFAEAPGLGIDLPEADTLDQRREVPLDDLDEER
jgi:hypothetical protein